MKKIESIYISVIAFIFLLFAGCYGCVKSDWDTSVEIGYKAGKEGISHEHNPFLTSQARGWLAGWSKAQEEFKKERENSND